MLNAEEGAQQLLRLGSSVNQPQKQAIPAACRCHTHVTIRAWCCGSSCGCFLGSPAGRLGGILLRLMLETADNRTGAPGGRSPVRLPQEAKRILCRSEERRVGKECR